MDNQNSCPCSATPRHSGPSGTNVSTIWQTMLKNVREADEQRVDNTKEDIDTLLVFAGLFSAVVTTFVVDSYSNLQPDNTDEMVFLMRQSLAQNYTYVDGILRPVAPFPDQPPFEAPLWAIRVNGLWFASLIISLSTASFGMLVKQWLIEYLAADRHYISPQDKLRARQYRHPGLMDWKVFEIAALLPILLHISLGLFFAGLCFYTAAANELVGRSTYPLIAGWAFFALLTIVVPLFSPRCPYKVTAFKTITRIGRRYIFSRLWRPTRIIARSIISATKWLWRNVIQLPYRLWRRLIAGFEALTRARSNMPLVLVIPVVISFVPFLLVQYILVYSAQLVLVIIRDPETDRDEEDDVLKRSDKTFEVLLSVDEVRADDGLILETMVDLMKQPSASDPSDIVAFALGCLRHRVTASEDLIPDVKKPIRGPLPDTLSEHTWILLTSLVGEALERSANPHDAHNVLGDVFKANAAVVLLIESRWSLPSKVLAMLDNPVKLASLLQALRTVLRQWAVRDVCSIVEAALTRLTINGRQHDLACLGASSPEVWTIVVRILLESTWREDPYESDHDAKTYVMDPNALDMLSALLGAASPAIFRSLLGQVQHTSSTSLHLEKSHDMPGASAEMQYLAVAPQLDIALAGEAPNLVSNAMEFYTRYFSENPCQTWHPPLWKVLRQRKPQEFLLPALRPVVCDLWNFLCRIDVETGASNVDFVKLCIVLARPCIPEALDPHIPASQFRWEPLIRVLSKTADDGIIIGNLTFAVAVREDSIPTLAYRASEAMQQPLNERFSGISEEITTFKALLQRIAGKGPRPLQDVPPEDRTGILGTGIQVPQFPRRGRGASISGEKSDHWRKLREIVISGGLRTLRRTGTGGTLPSPVSVPAARTTSASSFNGSTPTTPYTRSPISPLWPNPPAWPYTQTPSAGSSSSKKGSPSIRSRRTINPLSPVGNHGSSYTANAMHYIPSTPSTSAAPPMPVLHEAQDEARTSVPPASSIATVTFSERPLPGEGGRQLSVRVERASLRNSSNEVAESRSGAPPSDSSRHPERGIGDGAMSGHEHFVDRTAPAVPESGGGVRPAGVAEQEDSAMNSLYHTPSGIEGLEYGAPDS